MRIKIINPLRKSKTPNEYTQKEEEVVASSNDKVHELNNEMYKKVMNKLDVAINMLTINWILILLCLLKSS